MADVVMKTGDTATVLTSTLRDGNGVVVNLTGATVKLNMRKAGSRLVKVSAAGTVVTPLLGAVSYTWVAADVDEPGLFNAEWEVTFSGGAKETFPNGRYLKVLFTEQIA
jgi:hypothetical protein